MRQFISKFGVFLGTALLTVVFSPLLLVLWIRALVMMPSAKRLKKEAAAMKARPPLDDKAFLAQLGVAAQDGPACLLVRSSAAGYSRLPYELVYPEDSLETLEYLSTFFNQPVGWESVMSAGQEEELGLALSYGQAWETFWSRTPPRTVAQLARGWARLLRDHARPLDPRKIG